MKQGIGFTVTINIIAIFIVVTFAFLVTTLNYYKAYKINNAISDSVEKYEGYNSLSINEINTKLNTLGYIKYNKECPTKYGRNLSTTSGYCIYENGIVKGKFNYTVITYLNMNIPIINQVVDLPVKTTTESMYYFNE